MTTFQENDVRYGPIDRRWSAIVSADRATAGPAGVQPPDLDEATVASNAVEDPDQGSAVRAHDREMVDPGVPLRVELHRDEAAIPDVPDRPPPERLDPPRERGDRVVQRDVPDVEAPVRVVRSSSDVVPPSAGNASTRIEAAASPSAAVRALIGPSFRRTTRIVRTATHVASARPNTTRSAATRSLPIGRASDIAGRGVGPSSQATAAIAMSSALRRSRYR